MLGSVPANGCRFRYAYSNETDLIRIAEDVSVDVRAIRDPSNISQDREWKAFMDHYERTADGERVRKSNCATIHEVGNRVWINAISLKSGLSGGAKLYHIVSTYAFNNGKVFIGDPAGLSAIAHYRRLENMILSAIRFETTDHLKPHPKQVRGLNEGGWKLDGLVWKPGDFSFNLISMLKLSCKYIFRAAPDLHEIGYDFEQGVFYDKTHVPGTDGEGTPVITQAQWKEIAAKRRVRTNGIGCNTLKRAVAASALLQRAG